MRIGLAAAAAAFASRAGAAADPAPPPAAAPAIVDKPISWGTERERLTVEYRRRHQDPAIRDSAIEPRMVVLHYTGGGSMRSTWRYFDRTRIESGRRTLHGAGDLNVSAHFLVDRDGTIYRLMPETRMARHCIGLNHVAIGVENVGDGARYPLTEAQVRADAALVRHLAGRFRLTHLIGHHESNAMRRHAYWREREAGYRNSKSDPGPDFMRRVRALVADLGLEGPPVAETPR
ncbi:MAG TPA: peptidoglycan recognition family protein [Kofleriaceae bacterium]|nr:peptidoglycan recognition family protein [Kofleriaceae bacterium]